MSLFSSLQNMDPACEKMRITELNPHLLCALCGGYLVDATTIVECLHSFCKTCIVRYLETSNYCPICEVLIHKTRPWQNIRYDETLQNIVYKMVPGLFKNEMKRRREFYEQTPCYEARKREGKELDFKTTDRVIHSPDEQISLSLEHCSHGKPSTDIKEEEEAQKLFDRRYLMCPAAVTVSHLKKFIRMKYSLSQKIQIDLIHTDAPLRDTWSLMDVAYIYSWRRQGILKLFYSFYKFLPKKRKLPELSEGSRPTDEPEVPAKKHKDSPDCQSSTKPNNVDAPSKPNKPDTFQNGETEKPTETTEPVAGCPKTDETCHSSACSKTDDDTAEAEKEIDVINSNETEKTASCSEWREAATHEAGVCEKEVDSVIDYSVSEGDTPEKDDKDFSPVQTPTENNGFARSSQCSDSPTEYESSPGTESRRPSESDHVTPIKWHGPNDLIMNGHFKVPSDHFPGDMKSDTYVMPLDYSQPS
ncbi:polycomb complex protein BMI-1-A-like isoform X3 [Haliotis cracherodii]|uniref:polycomb complex protein BMI-1-A-like isoform X3 n=1 Tax=Haliotis cracherodii TaxID=6455 RepID=UPI0039E8F243